jgi:hypothetical protein
VQLPDVHWYGHAEPATHAPLALHESGVVPEHIPAPGAQSPTQAAPTHAWFKHATGEPHSPDDEHVSTPFPEHWVAPAEQAPVHTPFEHVPLAHGAAGCHSPLAPQDWTLTPEHCVAPGLQTPAHAPPMQTKGHVSYVSHEPLAEQVSSTPPSPAHCVAPGAHVPTHAPPTHAEFTHGTPGVHPPPAQSWTVLPEHCEVPASHEGGGGTEASQPAPTQPASAVESGLEASGSGGVAASEPLLGGGGGGGAAEPSAEESDDDASTPGVSVDGCPPEVPMGEEASLPLSEAPSPGGVTRGETAVPPQAMATVQALSAEARTQAFSFTVALYAGAGSHLPFGSQNWKVIARPPLGEAPPSRARLREGASQGASTRVDCADVEGSGVVWKKTIPPTTARVRPMPTVAAQATSVLSENVGHEPEVSTCPYALVVELEQRMSGVMSAPVAVAAPRRPMTPLTIGTGEDLLAPAAGLGQAVAPKARHGRRSAARGNEDQGILSFFTAGRTNSFPDEERRGGFEERRSLSPRRVTEA